MSKGSVATMILPAGVLKQYVDTLTPLVTEGRVHFSDEGITTRVVDPSNAATILPAHLSTEAFESFEAPGRATIGLDFTTLADRIDGADADDLVHLSVNMETRHLDIEFRNVEHSIGMIDPQSIRDEPDGPDLDLPNWFTVEAGDLDMAITECEKVSDHVEIAANTDAESVTLTAEGDIDDTVITFDHDDVVEAHMPEAAESLFSLDFLDVLTTNIPAGVEVRITFGDEFPMMLDWTACEGALDVHQLLAPRVVSK